MGSDPETRACWARISMVGTPSKPGGHKSSVKFNQLTGPQLDFKHGHAHARTHGIGKLEHGASPMDAYWDCE